MRQPARRVAVVRDGSFLGVAAEREEQAIRAREALKKSARWKESECAAAVGRRPLRAPDGAAGVARLDGQREDGPPPPPRRSRTLSAIYTRPFQCHGSIGPSCAVAQWQRAAS